MNKLSSNYIVDILNNEMSMPAGSVWLRDQNAKIPIDTGLYISVGIVQTTVMAAESYMIPASPDNWDVENQRWDIGGQTYDASGSPTNFDKTGQTWDNPNQFWDTPPPAQIEVNEVQAREMVQIDIFSRSNAGITRNWEVIAALNSFYSQQVQEANNFKIFRLPQNWINTSSAEGSSILNRYTITIPCFVWYRKQKLLTMNGGDYYDDFKARVDDAATIGTETPMIEFEINQEGIEP